jgi:hypothetical protein
VFLGPIKRAGAKGFLEFLGAIKRVRALFLGVNTCQPESREVCF